MEAVTRMPVDELLRWVFCNAKRLLSPAHILALINKRKTD